MNDIKVINHLNEKCRERNISVQELCRRIGMAQSGVYRKNNFTLKNICKMLTILNCKFEDVFEIVIEK